MGVSFDTTSWSTIVAVQGTDSAACRVALNRLCTTYWIPLYCYVRQKGHPPDEAQDLTQEFFCRMLERGTFGLVSPQRGRFRRFLMTLMDHFLTDTWRKEGALKRGGGRLPVALDFTMAEGSYAWDHRPDADPRTVYDCQWAQAVLDAAAARLRQEYAASGRADLFERLKERLVGRDGRVTHETLGAELGMTPGAVKAAVYRLRRRYAVCVHEEIAATLADEAQVEEELRYLFSAVSTWQFGEPSSPTS